MNIHKDELTACDTEPIHIPGKIQSHGFLVAIHSGNAIIAYISENLPAFIGKKAAYFLGRHTNELEAGFQLPPSQIRISQILQMGNDKKNFDHVNPFFIEIGGRPFNLIVTISGNYHLLEFEPQATDIGLDVHRTIGRSVSEILSGKTVQTFLQNSAKEIKNIIHYDRVMVYKFDEDGHGEVVAEEMNENLHPYLGLHFPASDIPRQARELYKINLIRLIADVNSDSVSIITDRKDALPLDLTHSSLRAVSPIHIQYLKNMGVVSSFSISIVSEGDLWGLIACHNYSPSFINYDARNASKLIGQILSSALEYREEEEKAGQTAALETASTQLSEYIDKNEDIIAALTANTVTIRDITGGAGAALIFNKEIVTLGSTPNIEQIWAIVEWLNGNMEDNVYYTSEFAKAFPPAQEFTQLASGIMACTISKELSEYLVWFKPEQITERKWAGNPEKAFDPQHEGLLAISPRKSFQSWTEIVKGKSENWSSPEISIVVKAREKIIHAINRKASEIRLLNERLQLAYNELDTFSFTISHDLRTPLSSIRNYCELLSADLGHFTDPEQQMLVRIKACADKMNFLITEILNYSRIGRSHIETQQLDMGAMLEEIRADSMSSLKTTNIEFIIGDTPSLEGEPTMMYQIFSNLIGNAIKYSSRSNPSRVKVEGKTSNKEVLYSVSDNGIGIDVKYFDRVFELFKRMDNARDFEGTGVGLAIVRRMVEKHNARIWFESTLGEGTVFFILFGSQKTTAPLMWPHVTGNIERSDYDRAPGIGKVDVRGRDHERVPYPGTV